MANNQKPLQTDFADEITEEEVTEGNAAPAEDAPPTDPPAGDDQAGDDDEQPVVAAKDVDGVPYCKTHHCRMKRYSGGKAGSAASYYRCPVDGCKCTAKIIRTKNEAIVPVNPVICTRCSDPETKGRKKRKIVVCERDEKLSSASGVVLTCPSCGWRTSKLADPDMVARHLAHRRMRRAGTPGLGDR